MSLVVHNTPTPSLAETCRFPARSNLFTELLGPNHDAWRVVRKDRSFSFYREIGHDHPRLPFGSIVLTTEPGKSQSFDFYSANRKHSLLTTFGDEVGQAAQVLMDREYIIALFTNTAVREAAKNWDHHLSFSGEQLTERSTTLRHGSPLYQKIVGSTYLPLSPLASARGDLSLPRYQAGLAVCQREAEVPFVRCLISYPRKIEITFASSRLTQGLDAITGEMVCYISELNRSVDNRRYLDSGEY